MKKMMILIWGATTLLVPAMASAAATLPKAASITEKMNGTSAFQRGDGQRGDRQRGQRSEGRRGGENRSEANRGSRQQAGQDGARAERTRTERTGTQRTGGNWQRRSEPQAQTQAQAQVQPQARIRTQERVQSQARTQADRQTYRNRDGGRDGRNWERNRTDNSRSVQRSRVNARDNDRRWSRNGNDRNPGQWDRGWRNDNRYDWRGYRSSHSSFYRIGRYYAPYRHNYSRISIGFSLGSPFYSSSYWINDPYYYRLPPAYPGYRWVRYYDDVLLVDIRSGYVVDVIENFFW